MAPRDPLWLQAGSHDAQEDRMLLAAITGARLFTDLAPSSSPLVAAGGGHGVVGDGLAVSEKSGTANMSVDVAAGQAFIRGTESGDQGVYVVGNDDVVNVPIATADGANPRIDLVVIRVVDTFYAGGTDETVIEAVTGTPAGSPSAPTPPENSLVLAEVSVPASDTAITNAQITDKRTRAAALGGAIVCQSSASYPDPAFEGMEVIDLALDQKLIYTGSAWVPMGAYGAWTGYTPAITGWSLGNGSVTAKYQKVGRMVTCRGVITVGATTTFGAQLQIALPFTEAAPQWAFGGMLLDSSAGAYGPAMWGIGHAAGRVLPFALTSVTVMNNAGLTSAIPHAWATGDQVHWLFTYEATS